MTSAHDITSRNIQIEFDWDSYIEENFEYKTAGNGEYRIKCFECGETKHKLYVNASLGKFNCYRCDFNSGAFDVFDFVSKWEGLTKAKVRMRLAHEYARTTPTDMRGFVYEALYGDEDTVSLPYTIKTIESLPAACKPLQFPTEGKGWEYMLGRGYTVDEVLDYKVHYVGKGDSPIFDDKGRRRGNLEERVIFPVYGGDYDLVGWQARVIDPNYEFNDKYMACPDSDIAKTLYPYVEPKNTHAVLVEGVLDAVACRRVEDCNAYACFGKSVKEEQMQLLKSWGVTDVTLFFDKKDAFKEMKKSVEKLKMYFDKVYVLDMSDWPSDRDAGDCLKLDNGTELLEEVLVKQIDVYSLKYASWKMSF